jgi:subtilisin family serine protease
MPHCVRRLAAAAVVVAVAGVVCAARPAPEERATPDSTENAPAARDRARHLAALGVDRWHAAGRRGQGVTVAVLDSGFRGYRAFLGGPLPADVPVKSFRNDGRFEAGDSQHGVLCAEAVHAVAPAARLVFANWEPDHPDRFLEAVRWARQQGARVFTCSVIMPGWSDGLGGGPVHAALAEAVGDGVFVACAGNVAQRHWAGDFRDADGDGAHEWRPGGEDNRVRPWGTGRVSLEVNWAAGGPLALTVIEEDSGRVVGRSEGDPGPAAKVLRTLRTAAGLPDVERRSVVQFSPTAGQTYRLRVSRKKGGADAFRLVSLGAGIEHHTSAGSVPFPGDGADVLTVGATDAEGRRLWYSACGADGRRRKPDLMAPVPFPSAWRPTPFTGTSAAAPQVAGMAALWWSARPNWSAAKLRDSLRGAAADLAAPGPDCETGYGAARLPDAAGG